MVAQVDAIVYLVDAADRERFPESQRELAGLLSDDGLAGVPFLVLGNKIDLPYAGGCTDRPTVAAGSRASYPPQLAQLRWRAAAKIRLD
jgi:50S ribosomal subunit-associated GTPase HflX